MGDGMTDVMSKSRIRRLTAMGAPDPRLPYRAADHTNPDYYRKDGQECIDVMPSHFCDYLQRADDGGECVRFMMVGFCAGNAFKYRWRAGDKPGQVTEKDLSKAEWYDAMALHLLDDSNPDPRDTP